MGSKAPRWPGGSASLSVRSPLATPVSCASSLPIQPTLAQGSPRLPFFPNGCGCWTRGVPFLLCLFPRRTAGSRICPGRETERRGQRAGPPPPSQLKPRPGVPAPVPDPDTGKWLFSHIFACHPAGLSEQVPLTHPPSWLPDLTPCGTE